MWTVIFFSLYLLIAISIIISILLHGAKPLKVPGLAFWPFSTIPVWCKFLYSSSEETAERISWLKLKKKASKLARNLMQHTAIYEREVP